jgi:hypothetical protein
LERAKQISFCVPRAGELSLRRINKPFAQMPFDVAGAFIAVNGIPFDLFVLAFTIPWEQLSN